jgi:hypothetical protein
LVLVSAGGFCFTVAPSDCGEHKKWFFNDGWGLDGEHSVRLADALTEAINDGAVEQFLDFLKSYPDYRFTGKGLREFIQFLRTSGGFEIW